MLNYLLLAAIGCIWGSQFVFNELAIRTLPPLSVAAGRLGLGLVTLAIIWEVRRKRDALESTSVAQPWGLYAAIALCEGILPCFLIPWGQQRIDSSIAAILMATIPIFTLLLSTVVMRDERWRLSSAASVVLGFGGVIVLAGPDVQSDGLGSILGELAVLGGALSFAVSLILMLRLPEVPPVLAMRNVFLLAALPLCILAGVVDRPWTLPVDASSLLAMLALGTLCGGIVYVMVAVLVARAGATFTSLNNYLVVLVGVFIGILFMGDALEPHDIGALVLILVALVVNQWNDLFARSDGD